MANERVQRKLAAILAADVVGYSRLMGEDEEGTLAALTGHRTGLVEPCIAEHGGRVFKTTGDGVLAEFASVVDAVSCAVALQAGMGERNAAAPEERAIRFRIGVNLGDVIVQDDDVFGDGVNVAARLEGLADPGGICVSAKVYDEVRSRLAVGFEDLGMHEVKNIAEPVRIYRLGAETPTEAKPAHPARTAEPPDRPSIAVLPFANMSSDPEQEYFADGIVEDIITDLSKVSGLLVIARNSSFAYRGQNPDLRDVCRDLGIRYVVEGSVRRAGDRVRITAQMIDGSDGGHVWAERYDRDLADIFAVQDEVTREIVGALKVALTAGEMARRREPRKIDPEAYDLLMRGRERLFRFNASALAESVALLERAIALEPDLAVAHGLLSLAHSTINQNRWGEPGSDHLATAMEIAEQACRIDPTEPQAHQSLALANLWLGRLEDAERAAAKSVELNPNFASGHAALGNVRDFMGDHAGAVDCAEKVLSIDPYYNVGLQLLGRAQFALGRDDEAAESFGRRVAQAPNADRARAFLAAIHGHAGRLDEARRIWRELMEVNPDFSLAHLRKVLPYRSPDVLDRLADGLRKAGLPA